MPKRSFVHFTSSQIKSLPSTSKLIFRVKLITLQWFHSMELWVSQMQAQRSEDKMLKTNSSDSSSRPVPELSSVSIERFIKHENCCPLFFRFSFALRDWYETNPANDYPILFINGSARHFNRAVDAIRCFPLYSLRPNDALLMSKEV